MRKILKGIIIIAVTAFAGYSIITYIDYLNNPMKYVIQSAPWYTEIEIWGISCLLVVMVCMILLKHGKNT